jgi:hypothetical protein
MKHFYLLSLFLLFYNFLDAKKDNPKTQKEKLKHALNEGEKGHPYTMFNKNRPNFHWTNDVITIKLEFTSAVGGPCKHKL